MQGQRKTMYNYIDNPDKVFIISTINDLKSEKTVYLFSEKQYSIIKNIITNDEILNKIKIEERNIDGIYELKPKKTKRKKVENNETM